MRRALVIAALLAGCYEPVAIRRESTMLSQQAGETIAAAVAPEPSKKQKFDQHYQSALAFYAGKKYPEAIAEFETAYEVDPQPLLIFNIAQAYRHGGQLDRALAKYRDYLAKDPAAERDRVNEIIREVERARKATATVAPVQ
ncbi:MAG: tetratricopeptide repeat protein [Kofleriaceae bacterium]